MTALLLDRNGGDAFLLVNRVNSDNLPPAYQYNAGAGILDKVVLEMGAALESVSDAYTRSRLSEAFYGVPRTAGVASASLGKLVMSSSIEVQAVGLSVLLRQGNIPALRQLLRNYGSLAQASNLIQVKEAVAFYFRNADPQAVQLLAQLAGKDGPLRLAAARALAAIHTPPALPALAQLLDAPAAELQAAAVRGLSSFVMSLPIRTADNLTMAFLMPTGASPFRTKEVEPYLSIDNALPTGREDEFVRFWKDWWTRNNALLLGQ